MSSRARSRRRWTSSAALVGTVLVAGAGLATWKSQSLRAADAAAANQPEPMQAVTATIAEERPYLETTTSIGTVLALRSVVIRNEVAGVVHETSLSPGRVVDEGAVLVVLDVSVEQAELKALEAAARLGQTTLDRLERLRADGAASAEELDQARAERDVALAEVERTRAVIARKTIRAPFRAVVGISDVHPGQYLDAGTRLTTLQGVEDAAHVDFAVSQQVASRLGRGDRVEVQADGRLPVPAVIVAVDARVDPVTRNAMVRARIDGVAERPTPGSSVRVNVPFGTERVTITIPSTALRKGPAGDHVFVLEEDAEGKTRAHMRHVRSGPTVGDQVVILDGLEVGDRIADQGSFKLFESALVAVSGGGSAAGGAP